MAVASIRVDRRPAAFTPDALKVLDRHAQGRVATDVHVAIRKEVDKAGLDLVPRACTVH